MTNPAANGWFVPRRYLSATYGGDVPAQPRYRAYAHTELVRFDPNGRHEWRRLWLINDLMLIDDGPVALGGRRLEFDTEGDAVAWLRHCAAAWTLAGTLDQQMYIPDDWWRSGRAKWRAACRTER